MASLDLIQEVLAEVDRVPRPGDDLTNGPSLEVRAMLTVFNEWQGRTERINDELEGVVADDLWPLATYQEMLFIK